jgi:hypothetical protein
MGGMTTTEFDELLDRLGRLCFMEHCFRVDRHGPDSVAFVREWPSPTTGPRVVDVVILFDEERASAFRTAIGPGMDVFAPEWVSWWYQAKPVWTLRAMIALPTPGHPDEPKQLGPPPPECTLPEDARRAVRVRGRRWWR